MEHTISGYQRRILTAHAALSKHVYAGTVADEARRRRRAANKRQRAARKAGRR